MFNDHEASMAAIDTQPPLPAVERTATPFGVPCGELLELIKQVPCGQPETYGATPLNHQIAFGQQMAILENHQKLVDKEVPEGITEAVSSFMKDTFVMRFHGRGHANYENYLTALRSSEDFRDNPQISEIISRAETGHASPAELLLVRDTLGIRSIELACLTHPYGKNIDQLELMRDVVRHSVELLGGKYYDEPETRFRVKGMVDETRWDTEVSQGFFMTRKRTLGEMPDGTVIRERTSFILRSDDEQIISKQSLKAIQELFYEEILRRNKTKQPDDEWQDNAVALGGLDKIASDLMEADEFTKAIPVSTTIYAFNVETAKEIAIRDAYEQERDREKNRRDMERFPALLEAIKEARAIRGEKQKAQQKGYYAMRDIDGMLYMGPDSPSGVASVE